jgi:predicted RNA binding protein YcfA (HicA-like mRNA interferase family)
MRQTGSHVRMAHPSGRKESIPLHKELRTGTEHALLKILKEVS